MPTTGASTKFTVPFRLICTASGIVDEHHADTDPLRGAERPPRKRREKASRLRYWISWEPELPPLSGPVPVSVQPLPVIVQLSPSRKTL